jgi:lysophospholipase L1-like esterase
MHLRFSSLNLPSRRRAASAFAAATLTLASTAAFAQTASRTAADNFALKNGDRVVFYGDSITDQRMYTVLTEQYIVTRFPNRDIKFVHSGWGGDRVTGGGGGPIDQRLNRDVKAYKPTVVTIMLGMNDGSYRAFDQNIFQTYSNGYKHMVDKIRKDNPGVRLTFIQPSPFDDVTRAPTFEGGYNAVLVNYGEFLASLASTVPGTTVADLNKPVVAMLTKANADNPTVAQKIIPDRVHPGWGGHLIMAQSLLRAWNAPSLVSAVTIDAKTGKASAENAEVKGWKADANGEVSWTATEGSLPFPIQPPDPRNADSFNLALASSDFVDTLDQEMLTVSNLSAPSYVLKIDDVEVGTFTKEQLASGVNLAVLPTPMLKQAQVVASLTFLRANTHNWRWREFQVPYSKDKTSEQFVPAAIKDIDAAVAEITKAQRAAAKPRPHGFVLTPKQ